ncbi:hypothetical protein [uncultured Gimesia sp.]|uniref:hypothetical protein n=1 Tax=uncultured Gimesia sp. TaxID=1678688 RepID=UPI0026300AF8|nr:hypothetical protein [uncultured Gimesia sp.]
MRRLFLGNYDFEHQLAKEVYGASGGATSALNASLTSSWMGLAEEGDMIYLPGNVPANCLSDFTAAGFPRVEFTNQWPDRKQASEMQLVPWGWSDAVSQIAASKGFQSEAPDRGAVQTVNARTFSFQLEQEWGLALPGSACVKSLAELELAVGDLQDVQGVQEIEWVIKANFSMSARERMRGQGSLLTNQIRGWAEKRLSQGQPLFWEPWVNRTAEVGVQFEIPREGDPLLIGIAPLLCDERGQYRGSRIVVDESTEKEWQPAIEVGHQVARRAQAAGYFGPLGIDAMQYSDALGELQWRAIQDVNARYTMGRLALGFSRFLKPDHVASWLHFPWKESYGIPFSKWLRCMSEQGTFEADLISTSPDQIDGQTLPLANVLLKANTVDQLCQREADLMRAVSELTEAAC